MKKKGQFYDGVPMACPKEYHSMRRAKKPVAMIASMIILMAWMCGVTFGQKDESHLLPPVIIKNPGQKQGYSTESRKFTGIPSVAVSGKGRLWAVWYAGPTPGEDRNNYVVVSTSGDGGKTWKEVMAIDPDGSGPVRAYDPEVWIDPEGWLWVFWAQESGPRDKGQAGVWYMKTKKPDNRKTRWSKPERITHGVMMCKPTVLSGGEWALPVNIWRRSDDTGEPVKGSAQMVVSTDKGRTWELRGAADVPGDVRNFDEHMIVERKDGSLWMLVRTRYGIGETISTDKGKTWSSLTPSQIQHPSARFFIRRLHSGNLLLVKHGPVYKKTGRSHLTAFISKDDGKSWSGGLLLDERSGVSYPDGQQTKDGMIHIIYDYRRTKDQLILLTSFTEEDVLSDSDSARAGVVKRRRIVSKGGEGKSTTALWSFETISNRTVRDEAGAYQGKIHGNPLISEGIKGNCLLFDGVSDCISITGSAELSFPDGKFSISAWVSPYVIHAGRQVIIANRSTPSGKLVWELNLNENNRFRFCKWNEQVAAVSSATIPRPGLWYHLTVTGDSKKIRIYVNGNLEGESKLSGSENSISGEVIIGGRMDKGNSEDMFYGAIDEIMISKRSLSGSAIRKSSGEVQSATGSYTPILPDGWDPVRAGNEVLERLISVTAPRVKGAHDAEFLIAGGRAYVVSTVNDFKRGHDGRRTDQYTAMSVINIRNLEVEISSLPIAVSRQVFDNAALPEGQTWVPRIIRRGNNTLRIYFVSQFSGRFAQIWYRDYDMAKQSFGNRIYRLKLKTSLGTFDMQPCHFHADAVKFGFQGDLVNHGIYLFDSFKVFDGITYVAINNFPGRQNALGRMNETMDTLEIIGHMNEPQHLKLSEASVERLPDGTWAAILRSQAGSRNYAFSESMDGRRWTPAGYRGFVRNGTTSKPTFNRFNGIYYLGWQDAERIDDVSRSVFNIDVSRDGRIWERKYRFETTDAFDYPTFKEYNGKIWFTISGNNQRTIKFGMLKEL